MVTLECLSDAVGPRPRFLDGRTHDGTTGLADHTDPPFTGTAWAVTTLAPGVVKFRCMGHIDGPPFLEGPRFLDGRTRDGTVGLAPMLAAPLSGERWRVTEHADAIVTLQCLGEFENPNFRFLDGRTLDATVGLAPHTDPPFTGTRWRVRGHGTIVVLESQGRAFGIRFLDGRTAENAVALAPMALGPFTGTRWLMQRSGGAVTLKCLGTLKGNRFLNGRPAERRVDLVTNAGAELSGTRWTMTRIPNPHADVEPGYLATLRCLSTVEGEHRFLDGITQEGKVSLAPHAAPPFTGTLWRVLPAGMYWEPCPHFHEAEVRPAHPTIQAIRTERIGQLTGRKDPEDRPLINGNTAVLGVPGVDLGANTEDGQGRLFIFFGDVVRDTRTNGPDVDEDAVAFTVDAAVDEFPGGGGGLRLNIVMDGAFFDPFRVDGPSHIGVTKTFEVPSGAFSHDGRVFVFFHIWDSTDRGPGPKPAEGCYLASKSRPGQPGPFSEVCLFSPRPLADGRPGADQFGGVAAVKVRNADHAWLPDNAASLAEEGIVMFGIGPNPAFGYSAIHLAWMPLIGHNPNLADVRYFTNQSPRWDPLVEKAITLFGKQTNLQSISAGFLKGLGKWIVLHMTADDTKRITGPVVARIGTPPFDWSEEFLLFDPCRERAYGRYMHWPDLDRINADDPRRDPTAPPPIGPGWAYGAFLLERFTRWDAATRELTLYYLLSLGSPYQVQVMKSRITIARRAATTTLVTARLQIHGTTPF
jgi:hypothetical protein